MNAEDVGIGGKRLQAIKTETATGNHPKFSIIGQDGNPTEYRESSWSGPARGWRQATVQAMPRRAPRSGLQADSHSHALGGR